MGGKIGDATVQEEKRRQQKSKVEKKIERKLKKRLEKLGKNMQGLKTAH